MSPTPKKAEQKPLAWFGLIDEKSIETFKDLVAKHEHVFEGAGIRGDDGTIEAYAVFESKKKMESFAKVLHKHNCGELIDYVT